MREALRTTEFGNRIWAYYVKRRSIHILRERVEGEIACFRKESNDGSSPILRIIYDNATAPPAYGEILQVQMLARFLALSGHRVEFLLVDDRDCRANWEMLDTREQEAFVKSQVGLAELLLPPSVHFEVVPTLRESLESSICAPIHILFLDSVIAREPIYHLTPYLLQVLAPHQSRRLPTGFLLEARCHGLVSKGSGSDSPYVAWEVRHGSWDLERNPSDEAVISDFKELRALFPRHSIMLFSTTRGTARVKDVLVNAGLVLGLNGQVAGLLFPPEEGFLPALPFVLGADFYFQRLGGGLGSIAVFSRVPYLIISGWDRGGNFSAGLRGRRIVPWASSPQVFAVYPRTAAKIMISNALSKCGRDPTRPTKASPN